MWASRVRTLRRLFCSGGVRCDRRELHLPSARRLGLQALRGLQPPDQQVTIELENKTKTKPNQIRRNVTSVSNNPIPFTDMLYQLYHLYHVFVQASTCFLPNMTLLSVLSSILAGLAVCTSACCICTPSTWWSPSAPRRTSSRCRERTPCCTQVLCGYAACVL